MVKMAFIRLLIIFEKFKNIWTNNPQTKLFLVSSIMMRKETKNESKPVVLHSPLFLHNSKMWILSIFQTTNEKINFCFHMIKIFLCKIIDFKYYQLYINSSNELCLGAAYWILPVFVCVSVCLCVCVTRKCPPKICLPKMLNIFEKYFYLEKKLISLFFSFTFTAFCTFLLHFFSKLFSLVFNKHISDMTESG